MRTKNEVVTLRAIAGRGYRIEVVEGLDKPPKRGARLFFQAPGVDFWLIGKQGKALDALRTTAQNICTARNIPLISLRDVSGYAGRKHRPAKRSEKQMKLL